jgi:type II secretory pathway component PulJ
MGYSTLLDILGSILIGGLIMLILFRLNASATSNLYNNTSEANVQSAMISVGTVLEHDFRKIGYCKDWTKIPDPTKAILFADTSSIKFLTDINNNGSVDTLYYYLGPTSELSNTPNPRDRLLYRVVNGETPKSSNVGITKFKLIYFDSFGNTLATPVTPPGQIQKMQIDLQVENPEPIDSTYVVAFWRQLRLTARNLQNR